jgi:hypothetical protein
VAWQIRYAHCFKKLFRLLKHRREPAQIEQNRAPAFLLHRVRMHTVPHFNGDGGCDPHLTVEIKSEADHSTYTVFQSVSRPQDHQPIDHGAGQASQRSRGSFEKLLGNVAIERTQSEADAMDVPAEVISGLGTRVAGD